MAAPVRDLSWLAWIERLVERPPEDSSFAPLSRASFYCRLDDQPDHLVPMHSLQSGQWEGSAGRHLVFNADRILPAGEWPSWILPEDLPTFSRQTATVWASGLATKATFPFWLGRGLATALHGLRRGDLVPSGMPERTLRTLIQANVFVSDDLATERLKRWNTKAAGWQKEFQQNGFAAVRGLIHPFHLAALRRFYRCAIRTGRMTFRDPQCPGRYACHNDRVARYFHRQLTPAVSELVGEPLKPSYVYVGAYQSGAVLEKHVDRAQCEFSVSLCLDYSPEPSLATPWPLLLYLDDRIVSVYQALGDGLLYRGRSIPHSRNRLPMGHTSTSIFFHYVREDYQGSLN
jgi:hypothetical protein